MHVSLYYFVDMVFWAQLASYPCLWRFWLASDWFWLICRDFADVLECVRGDKARVVAVTSSSRANEVNDTERPGFFDKITKVL